MKSIQQPNRSIHLLSAVFFIGLFLCSCSSPHILRVQYRLPAPAAELSSQTVFLSIQDKRSNDALLSQSAQKALKNFSGNFSLVVSRGEGSGDLVGAFNLASLFLEVFRLRLGNSGINVTADARQAEAEIAIELQEFFLDLKERKWMMRIAYRADLKKNHNIRSTQTVSGSAERVKVIGNKDAEKVLGELLTDMINELDLMKLFRQAGLETN